MRPFCSGSNPEFEQLYIILFAIAPIPRPSLRSETQYRTIEENGEISDAKSLPSWLDSLNARRQAAQKEGNFSNTDNAVEEAIVFMSLVVPAYNEEERLENMLTDAVNYLRQEYGDHAQKTVANGNSRQRKVEDSAQSKAKGWEIVIVSDGSTDKTLETALRFTRKLGPKLSQFIRVVSLVENRGKGGAVVHGMKYVRGKYAIFADADGASRFEDLGKLVKACQGIEDTAGRGLAIGSRAHLVGSEAVVKASFKIVWNCIS